MNQSTNNDDPVTIDSIKEILKKEERPELKDQVSSVLEWLDSDRPEDGVITLIELDSIDKLEKIFPYELLFETIRGKYISNVDFMVAERLTKLTFLHPDLFAPEKSQKIYSYLTDEGSPMFDHHFYTYLSSVDSALFELLNEIEKGEDDQYVNKMLKVGIEIRLIQSHLLNSIDTGEMSE